MKLASNILGLTIEVLAASEATRVSTASNDTIEICNAQLIRVLQIAHREITSTNCKTTHDLERTDADEVEIIFRPTTASEPFVPSSSSSSLPPFPVSFVQHERQIRICLKKLLELINRMRTKDENYFCTYKHEIYTSELRMVVNYLKEVLNACETSPSYDPLSQLHFLSDLPVKRSAGEEVTCEDDNVHALPTASSFLSADIVTQLFWLK